MDPALTAAQRDALLDCDSPELRFSNLQPCPFGPGDVVHVASGLQLLVTGVHRRPKSWVVSYVVRDDRPRLLRRGPPTPSEALAGRERHWNRDEEQGYTTSPSRALVDAGEAPSRHDQQLIDEDVHRREADRLAGQRASQQSKRLGNRLRRVVAEAVKHEVDLTSVLEPVIVACQRTIAEERSS